MIKHHRVGILALYLVALAICMAPAKAKNLVDEEQQIYLLQPVITESAWTHTGVYLKSFMFDQPNALSRPTPEVGFVLTPGFTWSILDLVEINLGFPMVLNPDESGQRDLDLADQQPVLKTAPNYDSSPDFELPGLLLGVKANLVGKKAKDKLFLAVGVNSTLPLFEEWAANFQGMKNGLDRSSGLRISPYASLAYGWGRFSPQLQVGASARINQKTFHEDIFQTNPAAAVTDGTYVDLFFNLALPFALPLEGTVPMLEINGIWNPDTGEAQVFLTPAVSFLPSGSPFMLGFACMLPIGDADWRENEGFRFVMNFSYELDALAIKGEDDEDNVISPDLGGSQYDRPPIGW